MGSCGRDGTYPTCIDNRFAFDRGSRRRVVWHAEGLDLEPPPISPFLRGGIVPGASFLIEFRPGTALLLAEQRSVQVIESEAPEELRADEAMLVEYLDDSGAVIATYWAEDPRIGTIIDPPIRSVVVREPSPLRVPVVAGAVELKITPSKMTSALPAPAQTEPTVVDLRPALASYCTANAISGLCS